jgi:hypothetical protein
MIEATIRELRRHGRRQRIVAGATRAVPPTTEVRAMTVAQALRATAGVRGPQVL